jgi:hypothetical protein
MPSKARKASPRVRPATKPTPKALPKPPESEPAPDPVVVVKPSIANPPRDRMDLRMGRYFGQKITRDTIRLYLNSYERVEHYRSSTINMDKTLPGVMEESAAFVEALEQEHNGALRALIACIVRWSDKPKDATLPRGVSIDGWVYFVGCSESDPDKVMGLLRVKREDIINLDEDI